MKRIAILLSAILPCLLAVSCNPEKGKEEAAPAQLGVEVKDALALYEVPKNQSTALTLAVVADPVSEEGYTITLGANPGLVASYNTANGTSYEMLPSSAFAFTSTQVMLPRYSAKSSSCELRLKGEGCEIDKTYLLPVVIDGVQGGTNFNAPEDKAAYILFKMLKPEQQGSGTKEDPYLVEEVDAFLKIGSLLKDDATVYFKMAKDIDLKDIVFTPAEGENPWKPINFVAADDDEGGAAARKRQIEFDGDGHKILNFKAGGPLFGVLCGSVQNLTVENAEIDSDTDDGAVIVGVAGAADNPEGFIMKNVKVINSSVKNAYKRTGGLVARMRNGIVENCSAECDVTGQQQAGGLIGRVDNGTVTNCYATGSATTDAYYVGGLIGFASNITVKNCSASGKATSLAGSYTRGGGLIGQVEGISSIEKCFATGDVEGAGHMAGGLVGVVGSDDTVVSISKCYATGNVTLPHGESGNWAHAGGLLGTVAGNATGTKAPECSIDNCYATGSIAVRRYSGGFVGSIFSKPGVLKITNSYTVSDITGIVLTERCGLVLGLADALGSGSSVTCTGFIAWNKSDRPFSYNDCVPVAGNYYGTEGSVSAQAKALNWDTSIWDLSKDLPTLK